jgi:hypothetical protein
MRIFVTRTWLIRSFVATVLPMMGLSGKAQADIVINFDQVGPDVVATGTGTINLTDLSYSYSGVNGPGIQASQSDVSMGTYGIVDVYTSITGPTSFGPGGAAGPTTGAGPCFAIVEGLGYLEVPQGYSSGTLLSATDTYSGATLSSLGLTPGTYTWNWGTGANADSLTINIGRPVPEPSSLVMLGGMGAIVLASSLLARRPRRARAA